jgi:hypothetical protein
MKKSIILILAFVIFIPFLARTQNEGIKASSSPTPTENPGVQPVPSQNMSLFASQGPVGGAGNSADMLYQSGSIYLEPGWVPGQVVLRDESTLDNVLLRYDIYNQQLQFIKEKDTLAFSKPEEVSYFLLDGKKFIYTDFLDNGLIKKGFFELITDDNCKLMIHRIIKYHMDADSHPNLKDDVYVRESQYYVMKPGDVARYVTTGRKSVLNALKDKEPQIQEFIDSRKMKMNTFGDLKEVIAYYNTLM